MRVLTRVLVILCFSFCVSCETTRLNRIKPGMTRTDVAIELGGPAEVRMENDQVFWVYPASTSKSCTIQFKNQKVVPEPMKCDDSDSARQFAMKNAYRLPSMNSEVEYRGRVLRYCGARPSPKPGCTISAQCVNGGWEEICP